MSRSHVPANRWSVALGEHHPPLSVLDQRYGLRTRAWITSHTLSDSSRSCRTIAKPPIAHPHCSESSTSTAGNNEVAPCRLHATPLRPGLPATHFLCVHFQSSRCPCPPPPVGAHLRHARKPAPRSTSFAAQVCHTSHPIPQSPGTTESYLGTESAGQYRDALGTHGQC